MDVNIHFYALNETANFLVKQENSDWKITKKTNLCKSLALNILRIKVSERAQIKDYEDYICPGVDETNTSHHTHIEVMTHGDDMPQRTRYGDRM